MSGGSWMLDRLGRETCAYHAAHDATIGTLLGDDAGPADYLVYLVRAYGFEAALESALAMTPTLGLVIDVRERTRSGFIALDLMLLGLRPSEVAELPQCLAIPSFASAAEALGWMYLVERSTLVHGVLLHHLRRQLPDEMARASTYLQASAGTIGRRWRRFGATLDRVARHEGIADLIVSAAGDAFECHASWGHRDRRGDARKVG